MVVKTYRGLIAHGGQDRIRLQTIKGKVGYRIVKFQIMQGEPGEASVESTVKIYKTNQTTINNTVNFTDSDLLAVALWHKSSAEANSLTEAVIFDNEVVNQDIYVTHDELQGSLPTNYYIELEVIPLDDAGDEYTTLKDMRQP